MRFGLSVESVQSGIQGQESCAFDEMQGLDARPRPARINFEDTPNQYVLDSTGTTGPDTRHGDPKRLASTIPGLDDYATTQKGLTDMMHTDELPEKQRPDTAVTSSSDSREQAMFLQLFGFVRDRLLATVGMGPRNLEAPTENGCMLADVSPGIKCPPIDDDTRKLEELLAAQRAVCDLTSNHREVVKSFDQLSIRESAPRRLASPLSKPRYDMQGIVAPGDFEPERGRSRTRQMVATRERVKEARYPPRRPASPNWNAVLGDTDPSFVPDSTYHCSRCLRKMPEADERHNARQVSLEYRFHISGDRCCRIRNGIGSAKDLPNRSGWIPATELPELSMRKIKCEFLKAHPKYAATLYPVLSSDVRNLWRSDPNNESNRANWDLPWPPHDMGAGSALRRPISEVVGVSEEGGGRGVGSGRCRGRGGGRGGAFPRCRFAASAKRKRSTKKSCDADDEYSDETSITDTDNELAAHDQRMMMNKKKRRRLDDATYRPRRDEHPDSDDEEMLVGGGAPERLRQVRHEMEQEINSMRKDEGRGFVYY